MVLGILGRVLGINLVMVLGGAIDGIYDGAWVGAWGNVWTCACGDACEVAYGSVLEGAWTDAWEVRDCNDQESAREGVWGSFLSSQRKPLPKWSSQPHQH